MQESDIRKIFAVIQECYSDRSFSPDNSFKIELWRGLLKSTPPELAQANLRRYVLNADNKFPPHPGILAATPTAIATGNHVPDAETTRLMLDRLDQPLTPLAAEHLAKIKAKLAGGTET